LFSKRHIYTGGKKYKPNISRSITDKASFRLDAELRRIKDLLPETSFENNEVAFDMDNMAKSFSLITIYTMIGDKVDIVCDEGFKREEKILRDWNARINIRGDTIDDLFKEIWFDNLKFAYHLSRIDKNARTIRNEPFGTDVQAIDPKTINVKIDPIHGWRIFEQIVSGVQTYKTPMQFIKQFPTLPRFDRYLPIVIPDDPKLVIHCSLFDKPPMDTALPFIIMKFWIFTFMGKYAEKMWSNVLLAFKGDPKTNYYPTSKPEMQEALNDITSTLLKIKNFSAGAFPGDTRVEMHSPEGNGDMYLNFYDKMDQATMFALFSSIAARDSVGVYKGNAIADEGSVRFMLGVRKDMCDAIKTFYVENLVDMPKENIHFMLPELRATSVENVIKALEVGGTLGIFKDANEKRRVLSQIITWLADFKLTDAENSKLGKEFMDLNRPSQPADGSTSVKNPKTKAKSSGAKGGRKS